MKLNILHQEVGTTRTGKTIICATRIENAAVVCGHFKKILFSSDDLLDVLAVFEYLSIRAKRNNDLFAEIYEQHSLGIGGLINLEGHSDAKLKAGVITVFDLRHLGQSLVRIEFKDS